MRAVVEKPNTTALAGQEENPLVEDQDSVPRQVLAWVGQPSVREPLIIFGISRALFLAVTYFAVIFSGSKLHDSTHPSFLHQLLPAWSGRWDTFWYTAIAQRGYDWHLGITSPTAFFPFYPLLIRVGVSASHRSYILVALVISNAAFLAALCYLWRLAHWEIDSPEAARRTILYVSVFPTALFFFAGYTESLFLLLTVASFYHLRRNDWLLAGAFGCLAGATRVTGVLLILPYAYEYARSCNFSWKALRPRGVAGLALIPCGLLAFMLYLHAKVGDALAFSHHQAGWQKITTLELWAGFAESIRQILVGQPWVSFFEAHNLINVGLGGMFLCLSVVAARKLPPSYALYLIGFWVLTLSTPAMANGYPVPLISLSRYVLSLFPVFMVMGILGRKNTWHDGYLVLSSGMLVLLTTQFITGGWVV